MKVIFSKIFLKIGFLGIILVALSLAVFSFVIIRTQREKLAEEMLEKAEIFAEFSANSIYQDYVSFYSHPTEGEFRRFRQQMERKMEKNEDIEKITLMALGGKVLFDSEEVERGEKYEGDARYVEDEGALALARKEEVSWRHMEPDGEKIAEIFAPVRELAGPHIMSVRYVLSYDSLEEMLRSAYRQIIFVSLLVFAASILLAIPLSATITNPIVKLTEMTEEISKGNLDAKIEISSGDEIGKLARSFNSMTSGLKEYRMKLAEHNRLLEEKVKERTEDLDRKNKELEKLNIELKDKYRDIERFNKLMVDRELKMAEMKKEMAGLKKE